MKSTALLTIGTILTVLALGSVQSTPAKSEERLDGRHNRSGLRISGTSVTESEGRTSCVWSENGQILEISTEGRVELTDDLQDIASVSNDGVFELFDNRSGKDQSLRIFQGSDGQLLRNYRIGRKRQEFDESTRRWFSEAMEDIFERTSVFSEQRVTKTLAASGPDGVLQMIADVKTDHMATAFATAFLDGGQVRPQDMTRLHSILRGFESDHARTEILLHPSHLESSDPAVAASYFDTISNLGSDHEQHRMLEHIMVSAPLTDEREAVLLSFVSMFESDYAAAEVLRGIALRRYRKSTPSTSYMDAVTSLDSDHSVSETLRELISWRPSDRTFIAVLDASKRLDSDHSRAELLREMLTRMEQPSPELTVAFFDAWDRMTSDHARSEVLRDVFDPEIFGADFVEEGIRQIAGFDSEFEKANALIQAAVLIPKNSQFQESLQRTLDTIDTNHDYERAVRALSR